MVGFHAMANKSATAAFRGHTRLILAIMVAVLVSMTFHHGAMASVAGMHTHAEQAHSHEDYPCATQCQQRSHSMPVCCAMGLCLSAIPGNFLSATAPSASVTMVGTYRSVTPRWSAERIDRPPKGFVRS